MLSGRRNYQNGHLKKGDESVIRILFFDPEQYLDYSNEPSNYELRLPVINCGAVTSYRDYIYQRVLRSEGREAMDRRALDEVCAFKPDLVINSTSWPHESISPKTLTDIMETGTPVYTHVWDTHIDPQHHPHEMAWFSNCTYLGLADSVSSYLRYRLLAETRTSPEGVIFTGGNNVFTDFVHKKNIKKEYDVTLLGSNEGYRVSLMEYLKENLSKRGIKLCKSGGLVDSSKGVAEQGLSDKWIPIDDYVDVINRSRICLSSQTLPHRLQIKGKVFHYLACGSLCLSDYNTEIAGIVPEDALAFYTGFEDCVTKIEKYLSDKDLLERTAQAGYRWFTETFDYRKFWSRFLESAVERTIKLPVLPVLDKEYSRYREGVC